MTSNSTLKFHGSPDCPVARTFTITLQLETLPVPSKKSPKSYRNPIAIAREYAQMLATGKAGNQSDLALQLGVSQARVSQYINLLRLEEPIILAIERLGDPMTRQIITEHRLIPYIAKSTQEQQQILRLLGIKRLPHSIAT